MIQSFLAAKLLRRDLMVRLRGCFLARRTLCSFRIAGDQRHSWRMLERRKQTAEENPS
jgi:hypothetical protein